MTLSLLTQRIHPALRHMIEPDAHLADLGLERVDLWGVQCEIEERGGFEFPREPEWVTVADVLASAAGHAPRVARPNWQALGLGTAEEAEGRN